MTSVLSTPALAPGDTVLLALASGDTHARVVELRSDPGAIVVDLFGARWIARGAWSEPVRSTPRMVVETWEPWRVAPRRRRTPSTTPELQPCALAPNALRDTEELP